MNKLYLAILVLAIGTLSACKTNDLGSGVNTMDREYAKSAPDVWEAAVQSAEASDLGVTKKRYDQFGGELTASRANGSEVNIEVKSIDEKNSRMSIRVGRGDRELANMLHERVAEILGMGTAETGWFGGNSLEATYRADLDSSTDSAHRTFTALNLIQTDVEHHASSGSIDGRQKDSTPVRITLEKMDDSKTRVTFIVGNSRNEDNKAFAQKMKNEFESSAGSEISNR